MPFCPDFVQPVRPRPAPPYTDIPSDNMGTTALKLHPLAMSYCQWHHPGAKIPDHPSYTNPTTTRTVAEARSASLRGGWAVELPRRRQELGQRGVGRRGTRHVRRSARPTQRGCRRGCGRSVDVAAQPVEVAVRQRSLGASKECGDVGRLGVLGEHAVGADTRSLMRAIHGTAVTHLLLSAPSRAAASRGRPWARRSGSDR